MKDATKHLKINCCNYSLNNFSAIIQALHIYMKGYFQANQKLSKLEDLQLIVYKRFSIAPLGNSSVDCCEDKEKYKFL